MVSEISRQIVSGINIFYLNSDCSYSKIWIKYVADYEYLTINIDSDKNAISNNR